MDDHTVTGRVVAILEALAETSSGPVALAELTARTNIPKPTVRRIANDLVARRLLHRADRGYMLGPRMMAYGGAAERSIGAAHLLSPFIHELHERTGMIAWAARADGTRLEIVDTAHGREHSRTLAQDWPAFMTFETMPGTAAGQLLGLDHPEAVEAVLRCGLPRATAYTVTMPGRYLERLSQIRDTGMAVEHEEYRLGWWCAAVSVGPPEGRYMVGTTGPTCGAPTSPQRVQEMLHRCRDEAERELQARN